MKGSRDNVIWQCGPQWVCTYAECMSERALITFTAVASWWKTRQGGEEQNRHKNIIDSTSLPPKSLPGSHQLDRQKDKHYGDVSEKH